ncbi:MAG: hypothetical protein IPO09_14335 [Anaeromyxobacter sp.]|nr:hypothetical protein [Anaeromyxobacter sp.]MBL0275363.1 hypothetical protein [Anaeromyxobacter sp.]
MTSPVDPREQDVTARLRRLRVDPPDDDFGAALHRRLAEAPPPVPPSPWARLVDAWRAAPRLSLPASAGLAAAAALAVFAWRGPAPAPATPGGRSALAGPVQVAPAGSGAAAPTAQGERDPEGSEVRQVVTVPATQVALVRLDLTVSVAVASADVRVTLPDGLVFWSRGQALPDRSFAWSQSLAAGRNEIPIAVRGQRSGRYHLTVTARVGGEWIAHDVPLEVTEG